MHAFPFMHTRVCARAIHDIFLGRRAMQQKTNERMSFQRRISIGDFDNRNVLVLDESSVDKNMSRRLRGHRQTDHCCVTLFLNSVTQHMKLDNSN